MNIIIAGGAGFLGRNLAARLIGQGHRVIIWDSLITAPGEPMFCEFYNVDVSKIDDVVDHYKALPERIDRIYHLASPASPKKYIQFPNTTIQANTTGTNNLLTLAYLRHARFLFASTSEIYGNPLVPIQSEDYNGNVDTLADRSVYDESKRLGETIVSLWRRKSDVDAKIIRIFNTYGPEMMPDDGRVVSNFICNALQNKPLELYMGGQQTRSFCYVDDLIDGMIKLMESEVKGPVNVGNPKAYCSMATLLENILFLIPESKSEILTVPAPTQNDPSVRRPDITMARELLGWEPKVGLLEGLCRTIRYFRSVL